MTPEEITQIAKQMADSVKPYIEERVERAIADIPNAICHYVRSELTDGEIRSEVRRLIIKAVQDGVSIDIKLREQ